MVPGRLFKSLFRPNDSSASTSRSNDNSILERFGPVTFVKRNYQQCINDIFLRLSGSDKKRIHDGGGQLPPLPSLGPFTALCGLIV
jgi:hypothetical protein